MAQNNHKGTRFENFIFSILDVPAKSFLVMFLIFASLGGAIMMLPTKVVLAKMLPGKSTNTYTIYVDMPKGSSIHQTTAISQCVTEIMKKEPEVLNMEVFLGQGSPLNYAGLVKGSGMKQSVEFAEIVINLSDKNSRDEKSYNMVQRLRPVIKGACQPIVKGTVIKMIEMPAGPPTLASIVLEVYGKNNMKTIVLAAEVADILQATDGLVDVDVMADERYEKYTLNPIQVKASQSGLSIKQVNQILYLAFEGMGVAVKNTIDLNDQISIFVSLSEESQTIKHDTLRLLKNKLSQLSLMNQQGMMIPLTEVVEIKKELSVPMIYHKNLKTMVNVVAETDMVSQVYPLLDTRDKMIEQFSDRYEVSRVPGITTYMFDLTLVDKITGEEFLLRFDGEMKVTLDTFRDLGGAFIAALVLIFLLLVVYYKSFALSGIVLGGSFLSIIGVIVGHWVANLVTTETFFLTATSLIGFIALMGISSRNSLLLIDFAQGLIKDKKIEKRRAIAIASATRAKPIMLTAIAIILGSALLASDPVFGGLGVALISGTIAAVIISLLFVPILLNRTKAI